MKMEEFAARTVDESSHIYKTQHALATILELVERVEQLEKKVEKQDRQIEVLYTRVGRMDKGM